MRDPLFRLACSPVALDGAPENWATTLLEEGEVALLADDGGLAAITELARTLDLVTVPLLRPESDPAEQERTVMAYAASLPLVWVGARFGDAARRWAHERGPMTLLVEAAGPLPGDDRQRIERFVAALGRQAE
jgi:hypothetical protein